VQQGGDLDKVRIDLDPGNREEARRLCRDEADATGMGDDPVREVEGGKQQLGLCGGGYGHAPMLRAGRLAVIGAATTERTRSVPSRVRTW